MKKFLVVVDMQKDFVDGALGTKEAEAIVDAVAEEISAFEGEIFVTLDTHYEDYLSTSEGKMLPIEHCIKGTQGWMLNEAVKVALCKKEHTVVEKNTFGSVDLPELIKKCAVGAEISIKLVGLCTDICVVSNALILKAHFPQSEITVDPSLCAGVTAESHEAALLTMQMCQINILGR